MGLVGVTWSSVGLGEPWFYIADGRSEDALCLVPETQTEFRGSVYQKHAEYCRQKKFNWVRTLTWRNNNSALCSSVMNEFMEVWEDTWWP